MRLSSLIGMTLLATSLIGMGCAPRLTSNLYARWTQQDNARRAEMEREEKIRAEIEQRMGKSTKENSSSERPAQPLQGVVSIETPVLRLNEIFNADNVAVVMEQDKVIAVITKIDLISYLSKNV